MLRIEMPRGDIRNIKFQIKDGEESYTELDEIYFTVKKHSTADAVLFQKRLSTGDIFLEDGYFNFRIEPEDTNGLPYGDYIFDIELVKIDSIKQTTVGKLTLTEEVTFATNEG